MIWAGSPIKVRNWINNTASSLYTNLKLYADFLVHTNSYETREMLLTSQCNCVSKFVEPRKQPECSTQFKFTVTTPDTKAVGKTEELQILSCGIIGRHSLE